MPVVRKCISMMSPGKSFLSLSISTLCNAISKLNYIIQCDVYRPGLSPPPRIAVNTIVCRVANRYRCSIVVTVSLCTCKSINGTCIGVMRATVFMPLEFIRLYRSENPDIRVANLNSIEAAYKIAPQIGKIECCRTVTDPVCHANNSEQTGIRCSRSCHTIATHKAVRGRARRPYKYRSDRHVEACTYVTACNHFTIPPIRLPGRPSLCPRSARDNH